MKITERYFWNVFMGLSCGIVIGLILILVHSLLFWTGIYLGVLFALLNFEREIKDDIP